MITPFHDLNTIEYIVYMYMHMHVLNLYSLLGMFYWMLLNIHPAHRSTLHTIQLLAVAKSADIKVHGMDSVLAPVVADLKSLAKDVSNTH